MIWLALPALAAAAYYALAIVSAARWRSSTEHPVASDWAPPISILKPVHGRDPRFYDAIRSHATQDYPEFELLFGLTNPQDPAIEDIERLRREFPARRIEIFLVKTDAPNAKVGVLAELAQHARHELLLVNDSDIVVEPGYLRTVVAPLRDPKIGLVTCLYRAHSESWPSHFEALGIATEFAPSVLVARLLGQAEFALGSTMVFRAEALQRIGGFPAIAKYVADDYQLGFHIRQLGYRIEFAPVVVETNLGAASWGDTWRHQLRWSRTIRVSRPGGYYGYAVTHATLWALVAFAAHEWWIGTAALAIRMIAGILAGAVILRDPGVWTRFWLIPLRDLFGFAVWAAGAFGNRVQWRDRSLVLLPGGVIQARSPKADKNG
jgi:ceramide glucosyltransferase